MAELPRPLRTPGSEETTTNATRATWSGRPYASEQGTDAFRFVVLLPDYSKRHIGWMGRVVLRAAKVAGGGLAGHWSDRG